MLVYIVYTIHYILLSIPLLIQIVQCIVCALCYFQLNKQSNYHVPVAKNFEHQVWYLSGV